MLIGVPVEKRAGGVGIAVTLEVEIDLAPRADASGSGEIEASTPDAKLGTPTFTCATAGAITPAADHGARTTAGEIDLWAAPTTPGYVVIVLLLMVLVVLLYLGG